jgi:hypothetical protein
VQDPQTQFYGDRTYRARDPEGHSWTFAQTVKAVTREEAEKASGLRIEGWVCAVDLATRRSTSRYTQPFHPPEGALP